MNIKKENKLIAEFMEKVVINEADHDFDEFEELKYHTSWNWRMPVVKKISYGCYAGGVLHELGEALLIADIDEVYKEVIEFINWYNEKKKS